MKNSKSRLLEKHINFIKHALENDVPREKIADYVDQLKIFTHGNVGNPPPKPIRSARKRDVRATVIELHCTTDLHNLEIAHIVNVAPITVTEIIREFHASEAKWDEGLWG